MKGVEKPIQADQANEKKEDENLGDQDPADENIPSIDATQTPQDNTDERLLTNNTTKDVTNTSNKANTVIASLALAKLWFVLLMTLGFVILLLLCAHLTHSLSLRVEAYHALYNILALAGCLVTMRVGREPQNIKNTFGWARVELLSSLITLIFLLALCFGIVIDSMQTAAHAGHQDAMHHPLHVIAVSALGLCLNALVFCLIGGYTHHQGCFLERRSSGVWIQRKVPQEAVQSGMRTISYRIKGSTDQRQPSRSYQGVTGVIRDVSGLVLCMICAAIVHWDGGGTLALYVDPGVAVVSVAILIFLSFPYGKECCEVLLQTIPCHIDVQSFSERLLQEFPEVINIHHLHIWTLTPGKVIATAHVVFSNPKVYRKSFSALEEFFKEEDITQVTLQPEFLHLRMDSLPSIVGSKECLLRCTHSLCRQKECCQNCDYEEGNEDESGKLHADGKNVCTLRKRPHEGSKDVSVCIDSLGTSAYRTYDTTLPPNPYQTEPNVNCITSKGLNSTPRSLWDLTEKSEKASSFLSLQAVHQTPSSQTFIRKCNSFLHELRKNRIETKVIDPQDK